MSGVRTGEKQRRRKRMPLDGCINCGGPCTVDAVDNFGRPYKGCPRCRFKTSAEIEEMCRGK